MRSLLRLVNVGKRAAGIVATVALIASAASAAPNPYVIPAIADITGSNAFAGSSEAQALKVFEQYQNKHGGLNGRPIHFEVYDDESDPRIAVQLAGQIFEKKPAPVAFLGPGLIATCGAIAPIVANGPVGYCFAPATLKAGGYYFAANPALDFIINTVVAFARGRNWKRLANISLTNATGQLVDMSVRRSAALPENRSMQLVFSDAFNATDLNVAALAARLKAANPQVVFTSASGPAFGTLLHGLNDAGLSVPVMTTTANALPAQLKQYAGFLPPTLYFDGPLVYARDAIAKGPLRDEIDRFLAAFKAAGVEPTVVSGQAWDPALIVVSSLRALGPTATAAQLHDHIEHLQGFIGSYGVYNFRNNDQHGLGRDATIMMKWDPAHGAFVNASRRGGAPL